MTWVAVGGAAVSVVGGMISGSKAKKAEKQAQIRKEEAANAALVNEQHRSNMLTGYAQQYQDYAMNPSSNTNAYGTANIDPRTGQSYFNLNSTYGGFRDEAFGQARDAFGLAGNMDPKAHAAERYAAAQELWAPQDARAESGLMMDLYNKGGFGLNQNRQMVGGGQTSVNPYVSTFMDSRNTRNAQQAFASLNEGESYLDRLLSRGRASYQMGQGIDQLGVGSMNDAMRYRDSFNQNYEGMLGKFVDAQNPLYDAINQKYAAWGGADVGFNSRNSAQQWASGANQMKGIDWGSIIGKIGGGAGGATSPYDSIPSGQMM